MGWLFPSLFPMSKGKALGLALLFGGCALFCAMLQLSSCAGIFVIPAIGFGGTYKATTRNFVADI